ncbi:MAG: GTPase, partial [Treponema porcinum]|uniref:GTPase n=2 Tax=Treponema TaxID=157 RepID=UPI002A811BF1
MNVKNKTPEPQRLHIVITGAANSGKSSLLNALTGQHTSVVSSTKGTTTDPVKKPMELHGTGPVIFVDTAGFGDSTELGAL